MKDLEHLKNHYFDKEFQQFLHAGDCHIYAYNEEICTCGLVHWCRPYLFGDNADEFFNKYWPKWESDFEKHSSALGCLLKYSEQYKKDIEEWINSDEYKETLKQIADGTFFEKLKNSIFKGDQDGNN